MFAWQIPLLSLARTLRLAEKLMEIYMQLLPILLKHKLSLIITYNGNRK
jgi:hypothetical protein